MSERSELHVTAPTWLPQSIEHHTDPVDPVILSLDHHDARQPGLTGAKAANLARARTAGLPALPGFVVTTRATPFLDPDEPSCEHLEAQVEAAWTELSLHGDLPLVVRSSSTVEDTGVTSMAGVFTSVVDVRGWDAFVEAMQVVIRSGSEVPGLERAPMGVLVQPLLRPAFGGVLFGADPVTGRTDRLVIAAVAGGPDRLVSGEVDGAQYLLTARGRIIQADRPLPGFTKAHARSLAELAARVAAEYGGPQDIEWAIDVDGTLRLLQARPITTLFPADPGKGPVLGPGPVAETFPEALSPLEEDLWVPALRTGIVEALQLSSTASARALRRSPVVAVVGGRVAADLDLLGARKVKRSILRKLDPRPSARRLGAAWRVGRLRAALTSLSGDLVDEIDEHLLSVPPLDELADAQLLGLIDRVRGALAVAHGHEILAGLIGSQDHAPTTTGASAALAALAAGRAAGHDDARIVAETPVVLALVPPSVAAAPALPPGAVAPPPPKDEVPDDAALLREALRLRVRWLHELSGRAAHELGRRLADRGLLPRTDAVRWLRFDELVELVHAPSAPRSLGGLIAERSEAEPAAPLPAAFRLTEDGRAAPVADSAAAGARGAGGGRGTGSVHQGPGTPPSGAVLVVRTLDPNLAPVLPHLGGLVAETGSILSHLAILAREFGVPTVVGVPDALRKYPHGTVVLVDGTAGEVTIVQTAEEARSSSSGAGAAVSNPGDAEEASPSAGAAA
jgi:pyruvate,water dikinase